MKDRYVLGVGYPFSPDFFKDGPIVSVGLCSARSPWGVKSLTISRPTLEAFDEFTGKDERYRLVLERVKPGEKA